MDDPYTAIYSKLLEIESPEEEDECFSEDSDQTRFAARLRVLAKQYLASHPIEAGQVTWYGFDISARYLVREDGDNYRDNQRCILTLKHQLDNMLFADHYVAQMQLPLPFGKRCHEYEQNRHKLKGEYGLGSLFVLLPKEYGHLADKGLFHVLFAMQEAGLHRLEIKRRGDFFLSRPL